MRPDTVPVGTIPSPGIIPRSMAAFVLRQRRFGQPIDAFQWEEVPTPRPGPGEVLVAVMSAGVNYNGVWAAQGVPVDVIGQRLRRSGGPVFHIAGSEASGIVQAVGEGVQNVAPGDEVVLHAGVWDPADPFVQQGGDPVLSKTFLAWGFETTWGAFAQFCLVKSFQCLPRPAHLDWNESAVYMVNGATTYRMLYRWAPEKLQKDSVVLIWGGAGGLGVMAIQIAKDAGAIPVAVVSSEERKEICLRLGAAGAILRRDFSHWGSCLKGSPDDIENLAWRQEAARFRSEIREITGGKDPSIVLEHPGAPTLPTSVFICERGGMVVICGATGGYEGSLDLRYLWMHQKRIQGSHFASQEDCENLNNLIIQKRISPVLSRAFSFEEIPLAHQLMFENRHPWGNMAVQIGSTGSAETHYNYK